MPSPQGGLQDAQAALRGQQPHANYSEAPHRLVKHLCPYIVTWLDTLGYDQALMIRDRTHMCLYVSLFASLIFAVMMVADLFDLNCISLHPWDVESAWGFLGGGCLRCCREILGLIIFFGIIRDVIQMLGNYDNEHQSLLQRKKVLMDDLKTEIVDALKRAKENSDMLHGLLLKRYESLAGNHILSYCRNVLPSLIKVYMKPAGDNASASEISSTEFLDMLKELTALVGDNVKEPGRLATAYARQLTELEIDEGPDFWEVCLRLSSKNALLWQAATSDRRSSTSVRRASTPPLEEDTSGLNLGTDAERKKIATEPGKYVFMPVQRIVQSLESLLKSSCLQSGDVEGGPVYQDQYQITTQKLIGFGPVPNDWDTRSCQCCTPRILALCFKCICCCGCICCGGCCCACEAALSYPKHVRMGFFWFQLISKLHERVLVGLLLSTLYCIFHTWQFLDTDTHGCPHNFMSHEWWDCVLGSLKNSVIVLALLFNIPALLLTVIRIRHLDAVIRMMEDVRKLQDLGKTVKDFEKHTTRDEERQALMRAVEERVNERIKIVEAFRQRLEYDTFQGNEMQATRSLLECLKVARDTLGPVSEWLELPSDEQGKRAEEVKQQLESKKQNGFVPDDPPEQT